MPRDADDAPVIAGVYADLKFIKTRSVAQVVIEVPIERADQLVGLFGTPQPAHEVHVAMARLRSHEAASPPAPSDPWALPPEPAQEPAPKPAPKPAPEPAPAPKPKPEPKPATHAGPHVGTLLTSQLAALLCKDATFQAWLHTSGRIEKRSEAAAASYVRAECGVRSRAFLDTRPDAAQKFDALRNTFIYRDYQGGP